MKLPQYLDELIFKELGGIYQTMNNVDDNLHNDERKNRVYNGTYFPRSFVESYKIFSDLFLNHHVAEHFRNSNEINILDIGAGSGGNLIGTLHALKNNFPNIQSINIHTIEGNEIAISYLRTIVSKFSRVHNCNVHLNSVHRVYTMTNFEQETINILNPFGNIKFDIIMSFKFFSEFYNRNFSFADGLYKKFARISDRYLKPEGVAVLLDVTTQDRNKNRPYTPIIMNKELSNYVRNSDANIKFILPLSCAFWNHICKCNSEPCYSQKIFQVSHSRASIDNSKVCYAVLVKSEFANLILRECVRSDSYIICYKLNSSIKAEECCNKGIHLRGVQNNIDAFKLNQ